MLQTIQKVINVIKAFQKLDIQCSESGVSVRDKNSGSYIEFGGNGNINIYASRNVFQDAKGLILQSSPEINKFSSTEEVMQAYPEWFESKEVTHHGCSHTIPTEATEQYVFGTAWRSQEPGFKIVFGKSVNPKRGYPYPELGAASYISLM